MQRFRTPAVEHWTARVPSVNRSVMEELEGGDRTKGKGVGEEEERRGARAKGRGIGEEEE